MTMDINNAYEHIHTTNLQTTSQQKHNTALKVWAFFLHFLEMVLAMMAGMPIFFMLRNLVPASSIYAKAFVRGTIPFDLAMGVFMTVPMVAYMLLRGHGWRHSAEMAFAMLAPVALVTGLRLLGVASDQSWFVKASHGAMFLGMLAVMLYRRDHYTGKGAHSVYAAH